MDYKNIALGGLAVLALLFAFLYFKTFSPPLGAAGGPQHYQQEAFLQGLQIGSRGTAFNTLLEGTCNLLGADASAAATSTASYDCAATGVKSGDLVIGGLGTTSNSVLYGEWSVQGVTASSTAGYVTFRITNLTGAAVVPSTLQVGSSTKYVVFR